MPHLDVYKKIIQIRVFESLILELFSQNKLSGTTHTYIGQEATAAAIMQYVKEEDVVFSNHRCHGHYLAYGGPEEKLLAEIMSKETGLCQGRGGSQHIHYNNFYTNGVQGGIVPNALGVAFAKKLDHKNDHTIVFLGDGTLGQGVVYESFNIAAIFAIPIIFVVEDNQYAMSTRRQDVVSGDIAERSRAFQIQTYEIESTDPDELSSFFEEVFAFTDSQRLPVCAVIHNYRLGAHSKGDDSRDPAEVAEYKKKDPLLLVEQRMGAEEFKKFQEEYRKKLLLLVNDIEKEESINIDRTNPAYDLECGDSYQYSGNKRCFEILQETFKKLLKSDERIVFMGEDIKDPYGGAFKVTKGLNAVDENRVFNMPISEACMVGISVGMALSGKIPVVEIMFGDFITLGFDQLLNHAAKYAWIYGDDVHVPMIIRLPMGAKRGYGPTHSQSLEKFLIGIPLINILALSPLHNPAKMYEKLAEHINAPTVVIENKKLYSERIENIENYQGGIFELREVNHYGCSTFSLTLDADGTPDLYLITYGGMVRETLEAAMSLMLEEEIQADVIVLGQLLPVPWEDIRAVVRDGVDLVTVEEGTKTAGVGSEIISLCAENNLGRKYYRIAAEDVPIPNGMVLEQQIVPSKETIIQIVKESVYGN